LKRLQDCEDALKVFFENSFGLGKKYAVCLWQLPPGFRVQIKRLEEFCILIKEMGEGLLHAFEFRHPSWFCPSVYKVLERFHYALCIAHSGRWPMAEVVTAPFVYIRFHGGQILYGSEYSLEELLPWTEKIKEYMKKGLNVYVYFNNDAHGFAVKNAKMLAELCKI
jgi:uncharacterized protein YecE (DUF72 family)